MLSLCQVPDWGTLSTSCLLVVFLQPHKPWLWWRGTFLEPGLPHWVSWQQLVTCSSLGVVHFNKMNRPGMLLISYNAQGSPFKKELSNPNCPKNRGWKPLICWTWPVSPWEIGRTYIGVLVGGWGGGGVQWGRSVSFWDLRVFWMNTFPRETKISIARAGVQGNGIVRPERWRPWPLNVNATQSCFDVGARAPSPGYMLLACSPHTPWPPCTTSLSSCSFKVGTSLNVHLRQSSDCQAHIPSADLACPIMRQREKNFEECVKMSSFC